ncbi:MAG: hypothetical protein WBO73_06765 [Gammaproteobacteria bacterium]|jgi:hypothetical protein
MNIYDIDPRVDPDHLWFFIVRPGEINGFAAFLTNLVDGMGIANALVIRGQALLLPIRAIVFPG